MGSWKDENSMIIIFLYSSAAAIHPNTIGKRRAKGIIRICHVFGRVCIKSMDPSTILELLEEAALTMCLLEKFFLPSFFDIMMHLSIHVMQQLDICGPMHTRWTYPMERYLKTLKGYVWQWAQPKGSIAQGYIIDKVLGFCTECMQGCPLIPRKVWDDKEDPTMNDELVEGKGRQWTLSMELRERIHEFVLNNTKLLQLYMEYVISLCPWMYIGIAILYTNYP